MFDPIGDRFKEYELASRATLPRRMPVILRVDGKAFHSYTTGCQRPFDKRLMNAMNNVALKLCKEIHGAKLAFLQSDEITILIHNYKKLNSGAWFDNQVQKMVSVSAAIASTTMTIESEAVFEKIKPAYFDSRVFVVPESEVCNAYLWRQKDCIRNSVQMLARSLFSHKECNNKNVQQLKELCLTKGTDWDSMPPEFRHGRCVLKIDSKWVVDENLPIFLGKDRIYVERFLAVEPEKYEDPAMKTMEASHEEAPCLLP
jgi:tRNA(His) guanylyltransferase